MLLAIRLLILVPLALAESPLSLLGRLPLTCPVCRREFQTVVCTQTNTRAGVDRDLFARALGPQPEYYRVSTCPACGYSGYVPDFDPAVTLPPDVRDKILTDPRHALPAGVTPHGDPRELDAADRYALAITCYRWLGRSDESLAWLHLRASWIARDEGSMLPREPRFERVLGHLERWRPTTTLEGNQLDVEMQLVTRAAEALNLGRFNRYQRPYVELAIALILRSHGENPVAQPLLEQLLADERFPESIHAGLTRMLESIRKEREHQIEAAHHFERAIQSRAVTEGNHGPACYLLGELYRRLGRDDEAVTW